MPHAKLPCAKSAGLVTSLVAAVTICLNCGANAAGDLDRAYRTIAAKRVVDLTHSFGADTPVWSGFGQARMTPAVDPKTREPYTIAKDGFRTTFYEMVGQYGTHVDPPAHFAEDGVTMDKIPVKQMIMPLVVLDDTRFLGKDPNHAFSVADLMAWEKAHGRVPKGAFVALRTDMYKDWDANPERFKRSEFPAWSLETVKFLIEKRGVTAIGHESMDTDTTEKWSPRPTFCSRAIFRSRSWPISIRFPPEAP
jgi:kynurenine formamidase